MFSAENNFKELYQKLYRQVGSQIRQVRVIVINGISRNYLSIILQYLYTDTFKLTGPETTSSFTFWLNLLIYADYFMI